MRGIPSFEPGRPRGGAGAIAVPFGLCRGRDIWCGGAKAMPAAQRLSYFTDWYVLGQSLACHCS